MAARKAFPYVFVLQKPDSAVPAGKEVAIGREIVDTFTSCGFTQVAYRSHGANPAKLLPKFTEHYDEHKAKGFFSDLVREMAQGPVWSMVMRRPVDHADGQEPAQVGRAICRVMRARHARSRRQNTLHVSDSPDAARREIAIWYAPGFLAELEADCA